jgi:dienelactone hydrolase
MPSRIPFPPRTLGLTALLFTLLAGCASRHAPPLQADEQRVKQFSQRGYLTDDRFNIAISQTNWLAAGQEFELTWTLPVTGARLPLVVYLPGLGEAGNAGEAWRKAWAQAGYAVLSVQLQAADRTTWSSNAARRGDFSVIAKERYAAPAVSARMQALTALLSELRKRADAGDAQTARLDLTRIALAGYDIGAYSAMLAAGELPPGDAAPRQQTLPISAVIALSPYADFSGHPFSERYRAITGPVLSVSGYEDVDALGAVSSSSTRKAPFEYMPSHDGYLLWLVSGSHSTLSGAARPAPGESVANDSAKSADADHASQPSGSRHGRRGGGGSASNKERSADSGGGMQAESPTERAINTAVVGDVTTAFLDAYLKKDSIAQEWLHKDARRWIGDRAELRWK